METMLHDVGQVALRAIPTIILFIFLYFYLKSMLFKPLQEVLGRRREATDGARKRAQEALHRAETKVTEYEAALRKARGEIFTEQENQRKQWRDEQAALVAAAREQAMAKIKEGRLQIAADAANAQKGLNQQAESLADQIVAQVLKGAMRG
jgi:F-type H+-transporting ATPase subunit b